MNHGLLENRDLDVWYIKYNDYSWKNVSIINKNLTGPLVRYVKITTYLVTMIIMIQCILVVDRYTNISIESIYNHNLILKYNNY